jgi:acyl-CoA oxidase
MDYDTVIKQNDVINASRELILQSANKSSIELFHPKIISLITGNTLFSKTEDYDIKRSIETFRKNTLSRFRAIISRRIIDVATMVQNPTNFILVMNTLHAYDVSLAIKIGVNFGLFGANLLRLGNMEQVGKYVEKINTGKVTGCLAITEVLHGSNLKGLQTTVTIDKTHSKLIFTTPNIGAAKCWIGNAKDCTHAIVFAMLEYEDAKMLLPFLIRVRKNNELCEGIGIVEMGSKKGLNGVDNGLIIFKGYRASYNSLLNNFGKIDMDGNYIYDGNKKELFNKALSSLSGGRGVLSYGSVIVSLKALSIAIKYAQHRRQFTENFDYPSKINKEIRLIEYTTHYIPLMTMLAKSLVYTEVLDILKTESLKEFTEANNTVTKNIHIITSGMKILCSEHAEEVCSLTRRLCGGHGYSSYNEIAGMHNDIDIYRTFEGDNTVLRQEIGKDILNKFRKKFSSVQEFKPIVDPEGSEDECQFYLKKLKGILCNNIVQELIENLEKGALTAWNSVLDKVVLLVNLVMCEKVIKIFPIEDTKILPANAAMLACELFKISFILDNSQHFVAARVIHAFQIKNMIIQKNTCCNLLVNHADDLISKIGFPKFVFNIPLLNAGLMTSKL